MFLSVGLRWGLKLYIYNHPHADACTADPRTSMSNNTQGMIFIIILYNFYNLNSFSVQPHLISKPFLFMDEKLMCSDDQIVLFGALFLHARL